MRKVSKTRAQFIRAKKLAEEQAREREQQVGSRQDGAETGTIDDDVFVPPARPQVVGDDPAPDQGQQPAPVRLTAWQRFEQGCLNVVVFAIIGLGVVGLVVIVTGIGCPRSEEPEGSSRAAMQAAREAVASRQQQSPAPASPVAATTTATTTRQIVRDLFHQALAAGQPGVYLARDGSHVTALTTAWGTGEALRCTDGIIMLWDIGLDSSGQPVHVSSAPAYAAMLIVPDQGRSRLAVNRIGGQ
jgi:hypothetical protein